MTRRLGWSDIDRGRSAGAGKRTAPVEHDRGRFVRHLPRSTYAVTGPAIAGDAKRIEVVGVIVDVPHL